VTTNSGPMWWRMKQEHRILSSKRTCPKQPPRGRLIGSRVSPYVCRATRVRHAPCLAVRRDRVKDGWNCCASRSTTCPMSSFNSSFIKSCNQRPYHYTAKNPSQCLTLYFLTNRRPTVSDCPATNQYKNPEIVTKNSSMQKASL
jgi:hypothetical protein